MAEPDPNNAGLERDARDASEDREESDADPNNVAQRSEIQEAPEGFAGDEERPLARDANGRVIVVGKRNDGGLHRGAAAMVQRERRG